MRKVSVIVPIYKVEDYLEACISSILEQTYSQIEIVCVNDANPDNGVTILRRFMRQDSRIQLFHHEANRGLGAARNTGLRHATGSYVKFVDGDDALVPESIELLVSALEDTGADWAFGDFHVLDEHGGRRSRSPFHVADLEATAKDGVLDLTTNSDTLNSMWPSAWMGLWRKDRIDATACRFPENLHFEDHEFFFEYGFNSRTAIYVNRPLYIYLGNRPGQITRDVSDRVFDIFVVIERLLQIFAQHLEGDHLERFSARTAVRLIVERTWAMPENGSIVEAYRRRAASFLARFPREVLFNIKDWYITDEALERLLSGPLTTKSCNSKQTSNELV